MIHNDVRRHRNPEKNRVRVKKAVGRSQDGRLTLTVEVVRVQAQNKRRTLIFVKLQENDRKYNSQTSLLPKRPLQISAWVGPTRVRGAVTPQRPTG